nr:TPA_asm: photosystem II protein Psb30 [Carya palmeri]
MEPYILAQFYVLEYVFLSSRICQCQSTAIKIKKNVLFSYLNELNPFSLIS